MSDLGGEGVILGRMTVEQSWHCTHIFSDVDSREYQLMYIAPVGWWKDNTEAIYKQTSQTFRASNSDTHQVS
jgi:hypothetical protein